MSLYGGLGIAALGAFIGLLDWRRGLLACLVVGFLQDPLRKLTPGRPVAFVVLVGVVFVGASLGYFLERGPGGVRALFRWYPALRRPMAAYVAIVLAQAAVTVLRVGSPVLAGIGLLSYASPFVALFLGHQFCSSARRIGQWQKVYLAGALTVGTSILLAFLGLRSRLFDSIGDELVYGRGGGVRMVSGLLRSSEIAAWHAATAACLVLAWMVARRRIGASIAGSVVTLGLVLAVILTGRRKTLGEMILFVAVFAFLLLRSRGGRRRLVRIAFALALALGTLTLLRGESGTDRRWDPYLDRGASVIVDAPDRLYQMTVGLLRWVVARNGFFGSGAGTGAQGAQYFGGGAQLVGWSAEGGLGRVTAELGVPGLVIVIWLTLAIGRQLWRVARVLPRVAPEHTVRFYGLLALLPANAAVFLTAHQTFGDPFVLIVMGFIASSALAFPQIVTAERAARARAAATDKTPPARALRGGAVAAPTR
jgi:hypothetical protein